MNWPNKNIRIIDIKIKSYNQFCHVVLLHLHGKKIDRTINNTNTLKLKSWH